MTVAWCGGDYEDQLNLVLPQLNHKLSELIDNNNDNWYIYVNSIHCKTGNKYYSFVLKYLMEFLYKYAPKKYSFGNIMNHPY